MRKDQFESDAQRLCIDNAVKSLAYFVDRWPSHPLASLVRQRMSEVKQLRKRLGQLYEEPDKT